MSVAIMILLIFLLLLLLVLLQFTDSAKAARRKQTERLRAQREQISIYKAEQALAEQKPDPGKPIELEKSNDSNNSLDFNKKLQE